MRHTLVLIGAILSVAIATNAPMGALAGMKAAKPSAQTISWGRAQCDKADRLLEKGDSEAAADLYHQVLRRLPASPRAKLGLKKIAASKASPKPAIVQVPVKAQPASAYAHTAILDLGPKPTGRAALLVKTWMIPYQDDMRAWLETMSPRDAKTLRETGKIIFSYRELKASDPVHTGMVDKHVKDLRASATQEQEAAARGERLPPETIAALAMPYETVGFLKPGPGIYVFEIKFKGGSGNDLLLSHPRQPKIKTHSSLAFREQSFRNERVVGPERKPPSLLVVGTIPPPVWKLEVRD